MPKIELLNVDCMLYMATLPDKAFDLGVPDPNYGIKESSGKNNSRGSYRVAKYSGTKNTKGACIPSTQFKAKDWDEKPVTSEYFYALKRCTKNQIIWGANYYEFIGQIHKTPRREVLHKWLVDHPIGWIVWDKDNGDTDFNDYELAWTSFDNPTKVFKYTWNGMMQGDMKNKEKRIHPTQKPKQLYKWLLHNYFKPGDRILDTHLGSGSSAIAAHQMGFDFVGCELDLDYYNAAVKRFNEQTMQQSLFGSDSNPLNSCQPQRGKDDTNTEDYQNGLLY